MRGGEWKILNGDVTSRGGVEVYGCLLLDKLREKFPDVRVYSRITRGLDGRPQFELRRRRFWNPYDAYIATIGAAIDVNTTTAEWRFIEDHYKVYIHDSNFVEAIEEIVKALKVRD